jgi:hypothetical protein
MSERWLPAVGWEGSYEVSDLGRVRSVERIITQLSRSGNLYQRRIPPKILSPVVNGSGYFQVCLSNGYPARRQHVHTLILNAFVGPKPENMEACHGLGGNLDNRVTNLRWDTRQKNIGDRDRSGHTPRGEHHGIAKLTTSQVVAIRNSDRPRRELALSYGVSKGEIGNIINRKVWAHV